MCEKIIEAYVQVTQTKKKEDWKKNVAEEI